MSIRAVIDEVVSTLTAEGLYASSDPGVFYPTPVGCLVGVPELVDRTLAGYTVEVPVHVVCAEPLDDRLRDLLFEAALSAAQALGVSAFTLDGWGGNVNQTDLPAYLLTATVTYS